MVNNAQPITQVNVTPGGAFGGVYREDCPSPARPIGAYSVSWAEVNWPNSFNYQLTFDFGQVVQNNTVKGIQSAFIDNTQCGFGVILQDSSGSKFTIPAGWQGILDVAYIQNGKMYLGPDVDNATMTQIVGGNAAPLDQTYIFRTEINFYGYKQVPRIWRGKGNSVPILLGHSTPTLGEFGVFYDQWQGAVTDDGSAGAVVLTPTFLNQMSYSSYQVTEIVCSVTQASYGGSQPAAAILHLGSGNTADPTNIDAQLIMAPLSPQSAGGGTYNNGAAQCGLYVGPINDGGLAESSLVAFLTATAGIVTGGNVFVTTKGYLIQ